MKDSQIAIVSHKLNKGRVALGIILFFDHYKSGIAHHVCVCEDSPAVDNKSGAYTSRDRAGIPRYLVIRLLRGGCDTNQTLPNIYNFGSLCDHVRRKEKSCES